VYIVSASDNNVKIGEDGFLIRSSETKEQQGHLQMFKRDASPRDHKYAVHNVKMGIKYYNVRNYAKAVEHFSAALKYDDAYSRAYYYLGNAYYKMRRMTDALCNWRLAIESEPDSDSADKARDKLGSVNYDNITVQVVKQPEY
jgi:tetratricopeptide (TPR) repeat protein